MKQADKIMRHLNDYHSITQLDALREYGIMRLASRISELRRKGVPIIRSMEMGRNRYGEPTRYARYTLMVQEERKHGGTEVD